MKIYTANSSRFWGSQIQAVEAGFVALGHEITPYPQEADIVYQNQPMFDQILADRARGVFKPTARFVFNVLDLPIHLFPDYDVGKLTGQLRQADAVTAISHWTSGQVWANCGVEARIVYNPIKPVALDPTVRRQPFYRFMHAGRRSDPNKRAAVGTQALQLLGYTERDLCLVGNETGWGDYLGVLNDENLNVVYNSVDFVLCCSKIEGLLLPALESMAVGAIPVICNDLTTRQELLPSSLFPEYDAVYPTPESVAAFLSRFLNDESGVLIGQMKARLHSHYQTVWSQRVSPEGVAGAILGVYRSLIETDRVHV